MTQFSTSALLEVELDSGSVRDAKQELEEELGGIMAGVETGGAATGATPDGGMVGGEQLGSLVEINQEKLSVQEDILDELETGCGGGGGGPGGSDSIIPFFGGDGGGDGGIAELLALDRLREGAGALNLGSRLRGGLLTSALTAQVTGAFGAGGIAPKDGIQTDALTEAFGKQLNDLFGVSDKRAPEGEAPIDQLSLPEIPDLDVPDTPKLEVPDIPKLDVPEIPDLDVPDIPKLEVPDIPKLDVPDLPKLEVGDVPELGVPDLPKLEVPDLPKLEPPDLPKIKVSKPKWLDGLNFGPPTNNPPSSNNGDGSGRGSNTTINVRPNIDVTQEGGALDEIEKQVENALDGVKRDVLEEVRREVTQGPRGRGL